LLQNVIILYWKLRLSFFLWVPSVAYSVCLTSCAFSCAWSNLPLFEQQVLRTKVRARLLLLSAVCAPRTCRGSPLPTKRALQGLFYLLIHLLPCSDVLQCSWLRCRTNTWCTPGQLGARMSCNIHYSDVGQTLDG